jgi:GlpG protein
MLNDFTSEKEAKALSDHLEVGGVEVVIRGSGPYELWVLDDDLVDQAEALVEGFDLKADQSEAASAIRKKREKANKPKVTIRPQASRDVAVGRATMAMMIISATVGLMSSLGDTTAGAIEALLVTPAFENTGQWLAPTNFDWSEPWRLLTPMFIHYGFMHLAFNMFWLYHFGNQIEAIHRTPRFLLLVALVMIPGSLAQLQLSGPWFGGMSGVNYGLFGFVWMQARYTNRGYGIENREVVLLMGWLVLCATGVLGPVANACHAVGLAAGILAGVPAYLNFRKNHEVSAAFEKGSWADLNVVGWQRFEQTYLRPYAPFWFLLVAMAVLLLDAA